jgi:mRNA interferase RelE/StbE
MPYKVKFAPAAARQIKKLPASIQKRIIGRLEKLRTSPRPPGVKRLAGEENLYRLPTGDYRIIYQIQERVLLILVVKIGQRRDVYRQ